MTKRPRSWILPLGVSAFVLYALNYLYFFVDDEAIPFVYAQNILRGRGLSYNPFEGRVEGYSDFLHVWQSAGILALVQSVHLPKWSVFFVGKAVSLSCGALLIFVTWRVLERLRVGPYGAAAGLALVCFSGPVAVWSNSSLETVPFALGVMVLLWALLSERDLAALSASAFLVLERIDGPVYATVLILAFGLCSDSVRRRAMIRRIVLPLAVLLVAYHGWRYWYFGDLLPAPLQSKVLYKVLRSGTLVVKAPRIAYVVRFVGVYGWIAASAFAAVLITCIWAGIARAVALSAIALLTYAAVVGDWMFGFRFFVAVVPMIAIACAALISAIVVGHRRVGVTLSAVCLVWSIVTGVRFVPMYRAAEHVESFLAKPSGDLRLFFYPYFDLYKTVRPVISPGDVIADNQAGFLPFMLDVTNVDDLGITSRFYARLPSTDFFFTEVGRYNPLTNKPALHAGQAYLLYRNAQYVIARTDLLRSANLETIPGELFGGYYRLAGSDSDWENVIYRRTAKPAGRFASDPRAFAENLAHVSYLRRVWIDGNGIPSREYLARLPFLREDIGRVDVAGTTVFDVVFADVDEPVYELTVQEVRFDQPVSMELLGFDTRLRVVFRQRVEIQASVRRAVYIELPPNTVASRFQLAVSAPSGLTAHGWIEDVRVQGQTPALEQYIRSTLTFPAAQSPAAAEPPMQIGR